MLTAWLQGLIVGGLIFGLMAIWIMFATMQQVLFLICPTH